MPDSHVTTFTRWLCLLALCLGTVTSQDCANDLWGDDPTAAKSTHTTTATDVAFLAVGEAGYLIACEGVIDEWSFYTHSFLPDADRCHDVTFQVWRPVDVSIREYQLVGENVLSEMAPIQVGTFCSNGGQSTIAVPVAMQLPVQPDDVIGWTETSRDGATERRFGYDVGLSGSTLFAQVHILPAGSCAMTVSDTCSWLAPTADVTVRSYALQAQMNLGPGPVLVNPPAAGTTIRIDENQPVGTYVFSVHALNNHNWNTVVTRPLVYAIADVQPTDAITGVTNPFTIDSGTGVITTSAILDYDGNGEWDAVGNPLAAGVPQLYTITVEVADGTQTTQNDVTVELYNVNEQHSIGGITNTYTVDASTTIDNFPVETITCDETEDFHNFPACNRWIHEILPDSELFDMDANGIIRTTKNLFEWRGTAQVYTLRVLASDGVYSAGPEDVYISVTNVRQPPRITNLPLSVTVREDDTGSTIFTVESWDDIANPVTYEKVAEYPHTWTPLFTLDANTGEISHAGGLDYVTTPEYQVEVTVIDSYGWYADVSVNLTVEIEWVNEAPMIGVSSTSVSIPEGEPIGTAIPDFELQGTDRDIPVGDWIYYTLTDHRFHPDNVTNQITTLTDIRLPNNQDSEVVTMTLAVIDSSGQEDTVDLAVTITDVNDQAPQFVQTTYSATVTENSLGETWVISVAATDLDGPSNSIITYSIPDSPADLYFQIDSTGEMTTKQPIDYTTYPNFTFTIMAMDSGSPALNGTSVVTVTVTEVNTDTPKFTKDFYNLEVGADTDGGEVVLTVTATDRDTASVNTLHYTFMIPEDDFNMELLTGEIAVDHNLGHGNKYLIYPLVADSGTPEYTSDPTTVRIDTYNPRTRMVSIYMSMPAEELEVKATEFLGNLSAYLSPWQPRIESITARGSGSRVRIYALADTSADTLSDLANEKPFVHRDNLLEELRTNIQGNPRDELKQGSFIDYGIDEVQPSYPVWIVDTVAGIATLTLLCLVVLVALLTAGGLALCKHQHWFCFKDTTTRVSPYPRRPPPYDAEQYKLHYRKSNGKPPMSSMWVTDSSSNYSRSLDTGGDSKRNLTPVN